VAQALALQRLVGNQTTLQLVGRAAESVRGATASPGHTHKSMVQRHSSWEHQLLGDADPAVLASFGTWQDLIKQTEVTPAQGAQPQNTGGLAAVSAFAGRFGFGSLFGGAAQAQSQQPAAPAQPQVAEAEVTVQGVGKITKATVMHNIINEMARLKRWQTDPPQATSTSNALTPAGRDPDFQVVTVALPGDGLMITYGEMNTLADFYGNLDVMKTAAPSTRKEIVQSVRKETFLRLNQIYDKLNASLTNAEKAQQDVQDAQQTFQRGQLVGTKFAGASATDFISSMAGQLTSPPPSGRCACRAIGPALTAPQCRPALGPVSARTAELLANPCLAAPFMFAASAARSALRPRTGGYE
jgi:hypothetical protein